MLSEKIIERFRAMYGEKWILRDLDFFPEKLSDIAKLYPYTTHTLYGIVDGTFHVFSREVDALDACIKIYNDVLHIHPPYEILERYWKLTSKK